MVSKGSLSLGIDVLSNVYMKNIPIEINEPKTQTINFDTDVYKISYIDIENGVIHLTKREQLK